MLGYIQSYFAFLLLQFSEKENFETSWYLKQRHNMTHEDFRDKQKPKTHSYNEEEYKNDDDGNMVPPQLAKEGKQLRRYNWTEIERVDVTDLQMTLKGLKPFTQYEVLLQAFNRHGRGPVAKIEAFTAGDGRDIWLHLIRFCIDK